LGRMAQSLERQPAPVNDAPPVTSPSAAPAAAVETHGRGSRLAEVDAPTPAPVAARAATAYTQTATQTTTVTPPATYFGITSTQAPPAGVSGIVGMADNDDDDLVSMAEAKEVVQSELALI